MIRRLLVTFGLVTLLNTTLPAPAAAQFIVYDPTNWHQAVLRYSQLVQAVQLLAQTGEAPSG